MIVEMDKKEDGEPVSKCGARKREEGDYITEK
jgi:hypothetical protein